jgi:hypothetical protein
LIRVPGRIGDTRTSSQKEEESKKSVYNLLTEEPQSWGALKKASKPTGISTATLAKYLKQFTEEGIVVRNEENSTNSKLSKTYYCLVSQKPFYGNLTEKEMYDILKATPGIQFSEEEDQAWGDMATALKIFTYYLAEVLASSSQMDNESASKYIETMLQVRLKERLFKVMKVYQKYKDVKNGIVPIASFAAESFMIEAGESAEKRVPKDLLKKYRGCLPEPETSIAWHLLTSRNEKEAIKKIENEIDEIQQAIADSYRK